MRAALLALTLAALARADAPRPWIRLSTPHFELLTTAGERDGRTCLDHLERLRRFFMTQSPVAADTVRVIAFGTPAEYAPYRLHDRSDAYYVGVSGRDYIVMASLGDSQLSAAAHEYAHLIARRQGLALPLWLSEGLAEVFSTVRIDAGMAVVGTPPHARLRQLRAEKWMPLADLLALRDTNSLTTDQASLFYAESWALTHMLMLSPAYKAGFSALLARPSSIAASAKLENDLRTWVDARSWPSLTLAVGGEDAEEHLTVEELAPFDVQFALAELLTASGRDDRAWAAWTQLAAMRPDNPDVQAAMGRLALARGKVAEGRARYQRAVALGIRDARLCADYAQLAEDAGLPESEVRAAYQRAVALDPAFDDAHYHLGLLDMHAERYDDALAHLRALQQVPEARAFGYYVALANTQIELGMREDAVRSAAAARDHAHTDDERSVADDLAWMAKTELTVQLAPDGHGRLLRVPSSEHGTNPFIAPGDRVERREGVLEKVDCGKETRLTVRLASSVVVLSIPDPSRVTVRKADGGTFEFTCGAQQGQHVLVEYAAAPDGKSGVAGVLRGIEIR